MLTHPTLPLRATLREEFLICVFFSSPRPVRLWPTLGDHCWYCCCCRGFCCLFLSVAYSLFACSTPNLLCVAWRCMAWRGTSDRRATASCRLCWSPVQLANYLKCFKLFTLFMVKFYKQNKNICREPRRAHKTNGPNCYNAIVTHFVVILAGFVYLAASARFP